MHKLVRIKTQSTTANMELVYGDYLLATVHARAADSATVAITGNNARERHRIMSW